MSATQKPGPVETQPANDPSMEDILASIRRILSEEEPAAAAAAVVPADAAVATAVEPPTLPAPEEQPNDVLVLDPSMLVEVEEQEEEVAAAPAPPQPATAGHPAFAGVAANARSAARNAAAFPRLTAPAVDS